MRINRFDSVPIRDPVVDKQTGFLHVSRVPIARVGVFPYIRADGSIDKEAKLPEDLLSPQTVSSANHKPVTDNHPHELITKDNSDKYMKGFTADSAHVEGNYLYNDLTITDSDLIKKINNGQRELSIGFSTELVPQAGTLDGVKYDSAQKNIQINHIAVVNKGRAGHTVRLLGDSAEMLVDEPKKGPEMETKVIRADGQDITVRSEDVDKVMKLDAANQSKQKKIAALNAQIKQLTAQRDELQGNAKASQDKADSLEKELAEYKAKYDGDALDKRVQERLALVSKVKPYVGDSFDFTGKSAKDLKVAAIKAVKGDSVDLKGKSDAYIDGYFAGLPTKEKHNIAGYAGQQFKGDSAQAQLDKLLDARYTQADRLREAAEKGNK